MAVPSEFDEVRKLTARIGNDRSLTQASTGNSSAKLDGKLWIKRSGSWMSAAMRDDIFMRLDLDEIRECLRWNLEPSEFFAGASLETAMHSVMPHRIVVHVHSVNGIAWAVRPDGLSQVQARLAGLRWQWIPYLPSGLPLAIGIEQARKKRPDTDLFILANHGLVIGGEDVRSVHSVCSPMYNGGSTFPLALRVRQTTRRWQGSRWIRSGEYRMMKKFILSQPTRFPKESSPGEFSTHARRFSPGRRDWKPSARLTKEARASTATANVHSSSWTGAASW